MKPPILTDLEYLLNRKEKQIELMKQQGKNTLGLEYEVKFLQHLAAKIEDLICEHVRQMREFARIEKDYKWNKKGYKIVSGLIAARKWAVLTQQPFAHILQEIEEYPERSIERYRDLLNWYREGDRELKQFEEWYSPFVGDYAETYKGLCEINGFDYSKRLKVWKAKTQKRLQDLDKPENRILKASIAAANEQNL